MDSRPWPEELEGKLRRQGLPSEYIDRLIEELADHAIDSQTENPSMEAQQMRAQLGTPEQLARTAHDEFRRRTFASRHPVLTFIVGPLLFSPLLFVLCPLLLFLIAFVVGSALDCVASDALSRVPESTQVQIDKWIVQCFNLYARFLPFVLAAWLFCRLGRRSMMPRWSLMACCIVALVA